MAIKLANERSGNSWVATDVRTWDIFQSIGDAELEEHVYKEIKKPGGCRTLGVLAGAQEGVKRLQELADVYIVTSPFNGSSTWVHERELWLEEHFGIHHKNIVHTKAKYLCAGDFFVDDRPENVWKWQEKNTGMALLWDLPCNRGVRNVRRVSSWHELYDLVKART